jgi:hypothetical protein
MVNGWQELHSQLSVLTRSCRARSRRSWLWSRWLRSGSTKCCRPADRGTCGMWCSGEPLEQAAAASESTGWSMPLQSNRITWLPFQPRALFQSLLLLMAWRWTSTLLRNVNKYLRNYTVSSERLYIVTDVTTYVIYLRTYVHPHTSALFTFILQLSFILLLNTPKIKQSYIRNRPWRPIGLWDIRIPHCLDNWLRDGGDVVSLTRR